MRIDFGYLLTSGFRPRFHPNGFVQFNLNQNGTTRLHVWPGEESGLKKQKSDNTIHDHIFDMESHVLYGKLTNVMYSFERVDFVRSPHVADHFYDVYQAHYPTPKEDSSLQKTGEYGFVQQVDRVTMTPGSIYSFGAFQYHDSIANGLTATVMHKQKIYQGNPRVLVPYGQPVDMGFSRFDSNPEELMWNQIHKVLMELKWFDVPDEFLQ